MTEIKELTMKVVKKDYDTMSHQIENISKDREIIKKWTKYYRIEK